MSLTNFLKPMPKSEELPTIAKPVQPKALVMSGTAIPKFEKSVLHAAARDALRQINEVNAFEDALAEEWLASSKGAQLRNLLREYIQHGHLKGLEG